MEKKQTMMGQVLQPLSPEEFRLHQWARGLLGKYLKQINKHKIIQPNPKLFVIRENRMAGLTTCYDSRAKSRIIAFNIHLSLKDVKRAKLGTRKRIELYSGKRIYVSGLTYLNYTLFHEIVHCLFRMVTLKRKDIKAEYGDLNEGLAIIFGQKKIINRKDGELFIAGYISKLLVEANINGCAEIRSVDEINLSHRLSPEFLELIQRELNVYFSQSKTIKKKYLAYKKKNMGDYEDRYSRGFVKLTRDPVLYKRLVAFFN